MPVLRLVRSLFYAQIGLTAISIGSGVIRKEDSSQQLTLEKVNEKCDSCSPAHHHLKITSKIFSGKGLDEAPCSATVSFNDPVVSCCGLEEVKEGFRALRVANPTFEKEPVILGRMVGKDGANVTVIGLHQRYFGWFVLKSEFHITTDPQGKICRFEERWNSAPLLYPIPFPWVRRLNGLASYYFTTSFLKD